MIEFTQREITASTDFSDLPLTASIVGPALQCATWDVIFATSNDKRVFLAKLGETLIIPNDVSGDVRKRLRVASAGFFALPAQEAQHFMDMPRAAQIASQATHVSKQRTLDQFLQDFAPILSTWEGYKQESKLVDYVSAIDLEDGWLREREAQKITAELAQTGESKTGDRWLQHRQRSSQARTKALEFFKGDLSPYNAALLSNAWHFSAESQKYPHGPKVTEFLSSIPHTLEQLIERDASHA